MGDTKLLNKCEIKITHFSTMLSKLTIYLLIHSFIHSFISNPHPKIYLLILEREREEGVGRERKRGGKRKKPGYERNTNQLPPVRAPLGIEPATSLVHVMMLQPTEQPS